MNRANASEVSEIDCRQPAVGWNDWKALSVPRLGDWSPELRVAVIIPARGGQPALDLTLASLAEQTYPSELLHVVVVDDASEPALALPNHRPQQSEIVRLEAGPAFGAGRARREGAATTTAEILLFADADIVLHREHVEAHARWHHLVDYAVTMGYRRFVSFDGLDVPQVTEAVRNDAVEALLESRPSEGHEWLERVIARSNDLTDRGEDPFRVVVGANMGVRRALYEAAGAYATFGRRGIEDTETGYRLLMAGGLFVPEASARSWHQGPRSMSGLGAAEIMRQRRWLLEHHLAVPRYRKGRRGRQYVVPTLQAVVEAGGQQVEAIAETVDSLLTGEFSDLHVTVVCAPTLLDRALLVDAYGHDSRVTLREQRPPPFPSPYEFRLLAGYRAAPGAIARMVDELRRRQIGALRVVPLSVADPATMPTMWRTDARRRAELVSQSVDDLEPVIGALYGEWWADGAEIGVAAPGDPDPLETEPQDGVPADVHALQRVLARREDELARLRRRRVVRWANAIGRLRAGWGARGASGRAVDSGVQSGA